MKGKINFTKDEQKERNRRFDFRKKIEQIFIVSGFHSLETNHRQFSLGGRQNELDHLFVFENILIIAEDTIKSLEEKEKSEKLGQKYTDNHKERKEETSRIINENRASFFSYVITWFPSDDFIKKYKANEFRIFYLYFDYEDRIISKEDIERYKHLILIDKPTVNYFFAMSQSLKCSFRYELFRYLKLTRSDVGKPDPAGNKTLTITASIIYPDSVTGFSDGIRMVSFMMKPRVLLENCCVLRKDSWKEECDLYQRLITPKRIKSIREYVCKNNITFLNNIIVTLPKGLRFFKIDSEASKTLISIDDIVNYENRIEMEIPADFNSMAIIDGQHRVYAYYQDCNSESQQEKTMSTLREEMNLLVTGIIYPNQGKYKFDIEKRRFESSLFVAINKNAKPVDTDTLIQVQSIMDPTSGEAISRKVIEKMNTQEPFMNLFELSKVEPAQIKTASIIEYALKTLVAAKDDESSLYHYWLLKEGKSLAFVLKESDDISKYINYCTQSLVDYFKAIKSKFISFWNKDSKLLQVISINAFLIAYRETLKQVGGPKKQEFYQTIFKSFDYSFADTEENTFPYSGAKYSQFARNVIAPLFPKPPSTF